MKRTDIGSSKDQGMAGRLGEALRGRGPLAGVNADTSLDFIRRGALVELQPGETLIREDESKGAEAYLLVEGALAVRSKGATLARLDKPGDVVGEVAVLLSSRRTADVVAESATRLLAIPATVLALPEYAQIEAGFSAAMIRDDWAKY